MHYDSKAETTYNPIYKEHCSLDWEPSYLIDEHMYN